VEKTNKPGISKKPNGSYYARWRDPSGKQRARTFDRKIDAERWLASVTVDTLTGRYVDPRAGRVTVAEYVARWAEGQPWRESTRTSRESVIDAQIVPTFGERHLASIRPSDVQAWVGRMSSDGLAASSVGSYFRVFAQIMLSARRDKLIAETPCEGIRLPRPDRGRSSLRLLTSEQVVRLADEVPDRYRALVIVSAALGLRQGEACGLTVDRVDFLRRTVTIDRQIATGKSASDAAFGPVKTPASNRTIPLPASVGDVLAAHIAAYAPDGERGRLLFTTRDGEMVNRQTWHGAFSAAAKRAGIEASSHDLRHHAASLLISAGCSPRAVASFLGHKNAAETLNTYSHLWPTDEGRIVAAIDEALGRDVRELCATGALSGS
jgi:integrase